MNSPFALLSLIVAIPFFGLLFVLTAKDDEETSGATLLMSVSFQFWPISF